MIKIRETALSLSPVIILGLYARITIENILFSHQSKDRLYEY